jgi:TPR repeat protein
LNSGGGCSNLGVMYKKGKGVKQDDLKIWFTGSYEIFNTLFF